MVIPTVGSEGQDIWTADLARGVRTRVTQSSARDRRGLWTLDGSEVVFESNRDGPLGLYVRSADGTGDVRRLATVESTPFFSPYGFSPDGRTVVFARGGPPGQSIGMMSYPDGELELLDIGARAGFPSLSPDGQWLAYTHIDSPEYYVVVQKFPSLGSRQRVSLERGFMPRWSPAGDELFYLGRTEFGTSPDHATMVAVAVETSASGDLVFGTSQRLFEVGIVPTTSAVPYDVDADGQRFIVLKDVEETASAEIVVALNWTAELQGLFAED